jgi:hypothetical protein
MHPDVDWPNGWEGGRIRGRANAGVWERQWAVLNPRVEPLRSEDDETGRTIVQVHQVVRDLAGNIVADQIVRHVYSMENGLIEHIDLRKPGRSQASKSSD